MVSLSDARVKTDVYLNSEIKEKAKEIFKQYGMDLSDALNAFLSKSVMEKHIPFDLEVPNEKTKKIIQDARDGKEMTKITLEELKELSV